jgi:hypothetical protein
MNKEDEEFSHATNLTNSVMIYETAISVEILLELGIRHRQAKSFHPAGQAQSEHPVVTLLFGPKLGKDPPLRAGMELTVIGGGIVSMPNSSRLESTVTIKRWVRRDFIPILSRVTAS